MPETPAEMWERMYNLQAKDDREQREHRERLYSVMHDCLVLLEAKDDDWDETAREIVTLHFVLALKYNGISKAEFDRVWSEVEDK